MITDIEQQYIDYTEANKDFLNKLHYIYYNKYKKLLASYCLKDYMITQKIKANKLTNYNNYTDFYVKYLEQLSHTDNADEGLIIYNAYFDCFIENMNNDIEKLKHDYNKTDAEIYEAYQIKTIWIFFIGFLIEQLIKNSISKSHTIYIASRSADDQQYIDDNYAIDIEVISDNNICAIQSKSITYLNLDTAIKQQHFNKHIKYKNDYNNSNTYYVLYKNYKPVHLNHNYLLTPEDIQSLTKDSLSVGSYNDLIINIEKQMTFNQQEVLI